MSKEFFEKLIGGGKNRANGQKKRVPDLYAIKWNRVSDPAAAIERGKK